MKSRILAVAGMLLASVTLAACGDDEADTTDTTTPVVDTTPAPAPEAAPPAMEPAVPAMEPAPPAMTPAAATVPLTLADIRGNWATDLAACATPTEVTTIAEDAFTGGGMNCTVTGTTPGTNGLDVAVSCTMTGAATPLEETWTVTAPATPINEITLNMGGDALTLVRCP